MSRAGRRRLPAASGIEGGFWARSLRVVVDLMGSQDASEGSGSSLRSESEPEEGCASRGRRGQAVGSRIRSMAERWVRVYTSLNMV